MKKYNFVIVLLFLCTHTGFSQDWYTDFEHAKTTAAKTKTSIILVFQGSDWCAPCIKLDKEIWSTTEFKNYATEHFVMLQADFPKRKKNALPPEQQKKNKALAEKYNNKGYFPFVVVLDASGKVLGQTGYKKITPQEYINLLESFKE